MALCKGKTIYHTLLGIYKQHISTSYFSTNQVLSNMYKDRVPSVQNIEELNALCIDDKPVEKKIRIPAKSEFSSAVTYDPIVQKFINILMKDGKKEKTREIVEQVLENIKMKQIENYHKATTDAEKAMVVTDPLKIFHGAVENCKPLLILKTIVKGGSGYRGVDLKSAMDFSSDDEELPQMYKPSSLSVRASTNQTCPPKQTTTNKSSLQVSIIIDSDEDVEVTGTHGPSIGLGRVNHSMSDSSEDEICLPSLRDRILSSVSSSKSISSSETIKSMKQNLSSENKSDKAALSHLNSGSMHSKGLSSNEYSSSLACSEETVFSDGSISTNNFDSNLNSQSTVSLSQSSECSVGELTKKKRTKEEIAALKNEAKMRKMNNRKAREEKALSKELERQRKEQIRIAERERKKQMGGSKDCLQYLILMLDTRIVNSGGHGVAIFKACEALGIRYIAKEQTVPFSITWNREVTSINVSRENQVETVKSEQMEEDVLVLLPVADFVNFVQNHKKCSSALGGGPTLTNYVHTVKQHLPNSILSFVVIGMEKYFRDQKTKVQRKHRAAVLSSERATPCMDCDQGSVHRLDVEEAITDNQLQTDVMVYLLETSEELAEFVRTFSKAVAEKPAKKDRLQTAFFDDGVSTVKVDKNGQGLLKVWKQQLLQFKNISPDIADAIVQAYPSPHLLMEAYRKCNDSNEQEKLLENIVVRRGAGVLETSRRVGKEMSRRIHTFVTSSNPNEVIK